jgi:hypothetical protein
MSRGRGQVPVLPAHPSHTSISRSHGTSPLGYTHNNSTETVPEGPGSLHSVKGSAPMGVSTDPCVQPKRCHRLHSRRHFGNTYVSTVTRRPQSSVRERILDNSGPLASDNELGVQKRTLAATTGSELHNSENVNFQGLQLLLDGALKLLPAEDLDQQPHVAVLRKRVSVESSTSPRQGTAGHLL